ncbi:aspartate--tRNA(Asn) ligase [Faecalicatena contorta]|uniref:Aspartate--tRNA(Asp/Asn) ligase n=1 Tax=Faecalicatena contorta TaxID=39482 RepID=A0A316AN86_9FIRM|nr:aspartate--tRNA(Asn) ligase [Faecalicatena contorta]PWJ51517.1 nondiscriminating aspartyl-tRNA synthetase [Faecalicatena contorta]SUQ13073.1 nondiscriminating aspartyl-tRNA synthetase [Faecalicatena contorta]
MEYVTGVKQKDTLELSQLFEEGVAGNRVKVNGAIHTIRDMGTVAFIILRKREGLVQCVFEEGVSKFDLKDLKEADTVEVTGIFAASEKAPGGVEIRIEEIQILSEPAKPLPLPVAKWKLDTSLEARLNYRPISLRNIRERAKFKIQEGIVRGFRDFLYEQGFTEIHTPKIGAKSAEGGANVFKLDYFHKPAILQQSPQFYKQMMVGVFDRVFETAPVFRAEKHNTKRHLNEYTSLDFEMGYIDGFEDIMAMEAGLLQYTMKILQKDYARELKILGIELPKAEEIPAVRFDEVKKMVSEKYGRKIKNPFDLEPEEELLIGQYAKEEWDADFVFVTHYPSKKRPFYAMDDPEDTTYTLSFDLLFQGMEITTGGQRIHDYNKLMEKMETRGMTEEGMEQYLSAFKHGMPPHGGLGIGLERLAMKLIGEDNVREATLFPRDLSRLEP